MIYLICQDWANTANNHAGIKYLCNKIEEYSPANFKTYVMPYFLNESNMSRNVVVAKIQTLYAKYCHRRFVNGFIRKFLRELSASDTVVIMEYMEKFYSLISVANAFKELNFKIKVYGMVHLVPSKLDMAFPDEISLNKWTALVDGILTLGSSLTSYFEYRGVPSDKLITTFHYVDRSYYKRTLWEKPDNRHLRVIAMGNQMRNMNLLKRIVANNPQVEFTICQGVYHVEELFHGLKNVNLIPFVPEDELKTYMEKADISLNVMEDTIGSNVIVTSMAMGLAMICSDVGSIRDYCNEFNCFFCSNDDDKEFSRAISILQEDSALCQSMKVESARLAERLTIENFTKELLRL